MTAHDPTVRWTGVPIAVISAILAGALLTAFGLELARVNGFLAVGLNLIVVGGAAPTVLRWRTRPVWRWVVYGVCAGSVLSFVALGALAF